MRKLSVDDVLTRSERDYFANLLDDNSLAVAISGQKNDSQIKSTLDMLIENTKAYRKSDNFMEMISFIA